MTAGIYVCIHGHFYQPPRENPWLGVIEAQPSARPHHDWNERITRECYGPNGLARVLGEGGRIVRLTNNYEYMSFNFGPTLLSWLEQADPETYGRILAADLASRRKYDGHGNALAQVYNHVIMPLANLRDRLTQIRWGLADFRSRFGREPEGMWLSETAVDNQTLALLAREGLKFTILAPNQARRIRSLNGVAPAGHVSAAAPNQVAPAEGWEDVSDGRIDPRRPYRVFPVAGDRSLHLDIFFYDGPVSRSVAYERLLSSGAGLLQRIEQAAGSKTDGPRLVNLATDGESYGHHFAFGEMALAWVFNKLETDHEIKPINYGAFLEMSPPRHEVEIFEDTSWSCAHGVERWRSDCGCCVACRPDWDQAWRAPLREGLDWLRDELATVFETRGGEVFRDPWAARDDYITVLLKPSDETRAAFLKRQALGELSAQQKLMALSLMESQLMSLYMFTSCGWFFDDITGLEPEQDLKYAARAMELVELWTNRDLKAGLLKYLGLARSNENKYTDGADFFLRRVEHSRIDPMEATAHFALKQLVEEKDLLDGPVALRVLPGRQRRLQGPALVLVMGEVRVVDDRTGQDRNLGYLALQQGRVGLSCLATGCRSLDFDALTGDLRSAVDESAVERLENIFMGHYPEAVRFTLESVLPEVYRAMVWSLAGEAVADFNRRAREAFETHAEVLALFMGAGEELPELARHILRLDMNERLAQLLDAGRKDAELDWEAVRALADKAKSWALNLTGPVLKIKASSYLRDRFKRLARQPNAPAVRRIIDFLKLVEELGLEIDFWSCQNIYYELYHQKVKTLAPELLPVFSELGRQLNFLIPGETK
jgi:alpha-amylase/alpha-mannosidase (GH57 family)